MYFLYVVYKLYLEYLVYLVYLVELSLLALRQGSLESCLEAVERRRRDHVCVEGVPLLNDSVREESLPQRCSPVLPVELEWVTSELWIFCYTEHIRKSILVTTVRKFVNLTQVGKESAVL